MRNVTLVIFALFLAGCAVGGRKDQPTGACPPCPQVPAVAVPAKVPEAALMAPAAPENLPVFADGDDPKSLLKAALLNRAYFQGLKSGTPAYAFGSRKVTPGELSESNEEFIRILESSPTAQDFNRLIKERFDIFQLAGSDSTGTVVFSSYYEPTLEASLKRTSEYKYPIYAKPDDLISINLEEFNEKFKGEKLTGRLRDGALTPYIDREQIDFEGALKGKGLELAWFKDRADIMDLHIEGSGRLALPDGRVIKANFASTNSLKFKGWLSALVEAGVMPREGISHEKGKQYLSDHPLEERKIMSANRRYTFFKLKPDGDPEEGPAGTYGPPLTGWRSIAIDNALVPLGTIAFMRVTMPDVDAEGTLLGRRQDSRFVFCQDTGGAIKGPGRVDFFAGNGRKARTFAFKLWDPGTLHLLVLKEAVNRRTLTGLDVLERDGFKQLEGKRVGLITNHSSVNRYGVKAADAFRKAGNFKLAAIFSPEHGFGGTEEGGVYIAGSTDPAAGVPVYSLYGKNQQRPAPEMLKDLDVLVFDIQDIGARFYTYLTTMGYAMEEAAKAGLPFVVLDRPNPIGGLVEGPVLEPGISFFTAYFPAPTRHGFTAGEMALFHKANLKLNLGLTVIKMENWTRDMFFDQTGVAWTNPSPNIRNVNAEVLYPGLGCFEASNVSVGRGTDRPFLWFGAPWMKAGKIAKKLSKAGLKGVKFSPLKLTPAKDLYEGRACEGISLEITDKSEVRALDILVHAVYLLKKYNGADFDLKPAEIRKMTGSSDLYNMLEAGANPPEIIAAFEKNNAAFRAAAPDFMLYK